MKYSDLYRVTFWGTTPDLHLSLVRRENGSAYGFADIEFIAVRTTNKLAGKELVSLRSIKAIECLAVFASMVIEEGDF